jgi:hypothetical protein
LPERRETGSYLLLEIASNQVNIHGELFPELSTQAMP